MHAAAGAAVKGLRNFALVAFVIVGCRQIVGIEDEPQPTGPGAAAGPGAEAGPGDANAAVCGVSFGSAACATCMVASCCAEAEQCASVAGCADFSGCVAACANGDPACTSACRAQLSPDGGGDGVEAAGLQSCEAAQCAAACQPKCGGYVYPDPSCGACGVASCCDTSTACMADGECASLAACERACALGDDSCLQLCELAYPNGVAHQRAFGACLSTTCVASCIASRWVCLEQQPVADPSVGPQISITYTFHDYLTGAPATVNLRACSAMQASTIGCGGITPVQTDDAGQATLTFPGPFGGYVEVTGDGTGDANDYVPVLLSLPALAKDFVAPIVPVVNNGTFAAFAQAVEALDPTKGHILAITRDCGNMPAGGVSLAINSDGARFYFSTTGIPSASATATVDSYAGGGFLNVAPATAITITATVVENMLTYPPVVLLARPGYITVRVLYATPP